MNSIFNNNISLLWHLWYIVFLLKYETFENLYATVVCLMSFPWLAKHVYIYQSMIYQVMRTVARESHVVGSRSVVDHYSFMKATKRIMTLLSIKNRTDIVDRAGFILLEKWYIRNSHDVDATDRYLT